MLTDNYPLVDPLALDALFEANNYNYSHTVTALNASLGTKPRPAEVPLTAANVLHKDLALNVTSVGWIGIHNFNFLIDSAYLCIYSLYLYLLIFSYYTTSTIFFVSISLANHLVIVLLF